jgi:MoaA/NifB/PqqE/SkfB family radical SAM enzyme
MCPRRKMHRAKGNMEFSLFTGIIDQIKDYIETIDLDLFGEFEYNPRWADMISYCRDSGLFTVLNTNATLLDEKTGRELISSGLSFLNISFDSANPDLYERIRKGADFNKTLENVRNFLKINQSIFTVIQMIHTTETAEEIENFRKFWKNSGVDAVRIKKYIPFDPETGRLDPEGSPDDEKKEGGLINSVTGSRTGEEAKKKRKKTNAPCLYLWKSLVICQDGTAVPCCVDYDHINPLGDAAKESILEIWNGKPMQDLRKQHVEGKYKEIKLCTHCRPLTAGIPMITAGALIDDPMRRKIMPFVERWV